jgi:cholesterol oxidase
VTYILFLFKIGDKRLTLFFFFFFSGKKMQTLPGVLPPNGLDLGREDAMYQFDVFGPVTVAHGCGLGGTSLVNAGVTVRPDPRMLTDSKAWPPSFLERRDELERGFARAEKVLGAAPYPSGKSGYPELPKHEALRRCTAGVGGKFVVPPVLVSFADTRNAQGVDLAACSNCGDCCSGCNVGAKRTLDTSYLADAVNHGAEIHTECSVLHVRGSGGDAAVRGRWAVDYEVLNSGFAVFGDEVGYQTVRADHVVIAAGAPGSTAIMLRTEAGGLALSPRLGESFSGNGDALGIAFNCDDTVRSLGLGGGVESGADTQGPGPCITAIADLRHADLPLEDGIVIEDGTPPGPFVGFFTAAMLALSPIRGVDTDSGFSDKASEVAAYMRSMLHGPYAPEGAMMRTQSHLVMSHDSAMGKIVPTWGSNSSAAGGGGRGGDGSPTGLGSDVGVKWPGAAEQAVYTRVSETLQRFATTLGGTHIEVPNVLPPPVRASTLSVHPLGGCPMGRDSETGVVDHYGRVFRGTGSSTGKSNGDTSAFHDGLHVIDASIIPRSVGINPLLTISAIAEMAVAGVLAEDLGRPIGDDAGSVGDIEDGGRAPPQRRRVQPAMRPGLTFAESMVGYVHAAASTHDHAGSAAAGSAKGETNQLRFYLCATSTDLAALTDENSGHISALHGTVHCPLLSAAPMAVSRGEFRLLVPAG